MTNALSHPQALIFDWEGTLVHPHGHIFPGIKSLLEELSQLGYYLAVATGKSRLGLDREIAALGLSGLFTLTRCAEETRAKPHPAMLEDILAVLGIMPFEALMIGDTIYDLQMAAAANVPAIAVTYGLHAESDLLLHKPVQCFNTLSVLPTWLEKLKNNRSERG